MEIISSKHGKPSALYNGFAYHVRRHTKDGSIVWRCSKARTGCPAVIKSKNGAVLRETDNHTCGGPDTVRLEAIKAIEKAKKRALTEDTAISEIYKQELGKIENKIVDKETSLKTQHTLKRTLYRHRSLARGVDSESIEEKLKQQSLRNIELNYPPVDTWNLTEDSIPTENQPTVSTSKSASTSISSQQKNTTKKSTKDKRGNPRTVVSTDLQTTDANTEDTFQLLEKIRLLEERNIQLHIENESYRVQNIMLETQKKKLIGRLRTIIKDKDPLEGLGEHTLVYEQQSQRLTLGPSSSSPVVPVALVASSSRSGSGDQGRIAGTSSTTTYQPQDQEFLDPDDPADDNAFLDNLDSGEIEIDVDHDGGLESDFEVLDIKPNILIEEETPPSPKRKRNIDATMPKLTNDSNNVPLMETNAKCSKGELKKKRLLCDFGDDDNEDDDNSQQDSDGDEFNSEDDSTKVRRAYQLLKSVFEKKDSYDLFCERLAGRLRALQSKKVCRHVQQMLVTVIEDAESGKYDNV